MWMNLFGEQIEKTRVTGLNQNSHSSPEHNSCSSLNSVCIIESRCITSVVGLIIILKMFCHYYLFIFSKYSSISLARVKAHSSAQSCSPATLKGWEKQGQSSLCGWHSALYDTPLPMIWAPSDILSYSSSLRQGENLFFISSQEKKW